MEIDDPARTSESSSVLEVDTELLSSPPCEHGHQDISMCRNEGGDPNTDTPSDPREDSAEISSSPTTDPSNTETTTMNAGNDNDTEEEERRSGGGDEEESKEENHLEPSAEEHPDVEEEEEEEEEDPLGYTMDEDAPVDVDEEDHVPTSLALDGSVNVSPSEDDSDGEYEIPVSLDEGLSRLAASSRRIQRCLDRIKVSRYDVEAWMLLWSDVGSFRKREARLFYDEILGIFPSSGRLWKSYIEFEIANDRLDKANRLFKTALSQCCSVDLWTIYVEFVRMRSSNSEQYRKELQKAFEEAIDDIGYDIGAGPLWRQYISFLEEEPVSSSVQATARVETLLKTYARVITIPLFGLEQFWSSYESLERRLPVDMPKPKIQSVYQSALAFLPRRLKLWTRVPCQMLAVPPALNGKSVDTAVYWHELIAVERSNPQNLLPSELYLRLRFLYRSCLCSMRHYPNFWMDAAALEEEFGEKNRLPVVLEEGLSVLPDSSWMCVGVAHMLEKRELISQSRQVYENFLHQHPANTLIYLLFQQFLLRNEGRDSGRRLFMEAKKKASSSQLFLTTADLERFVNHDLNVAHRILDLGLKSNASDPYFIEQYLLFLFDTGDMTNLRAVFESSIQTIPANECIRLWDVYISCERRSGAKLQLLDSLEARRKEHLRKCQVPSSSFSQYSYDSSRAPSHVSRTSNLSASERFSQQESRIRRLLPLYSTGSSFPFSSSEIAFEDLVEHRLRSRRSGMLEMIPRPSLSDIVIPRFSEMIDLSSPHNLPMSESSESVRLGEGSVGPNATANEEKDGIPPSLARLLRLLPPGNQYDGRVPLAHLLLELLKETDLRSQSIQDALVRQLRSSGSLTSNRSPPRRSVVSNSPMGSRKRTPAEESGSTASRSQDLFSLRRQNKMRKQG